MINVHIMKDNVRNSSSTKKSVRYFPDGGVQIDLDSILTVHKMVYPGKHYLKVEGVHMNPVKILKIWDEHGFIHMTVQHTEGNQRVYDISHTLNPDIKYYGWWITDSDYFIRVLEDRV
jgi:hypothetical protein